jgi:hypothetical protein
MIAKPRLGQRFLPTTDCARSSKKLKLLSLQPKVLHLT